jgi:hypothetical protein
VGIVIKGLCVPRYVPYIPNSPTGAEALQ